MSDIFPSILAYLTGSSAYHVELRTFAHVLQGAMVVRNGPNRDRKMHWFHAFALTTIIGFGGGWFTFLWMGKPTSMITSGDVNVTLACIAFVIVNYTPNDIGYKIANSLPAVFVITSLAQMFRSMGTIGFISAAAKEVDPSPYYPIPVVGPILYGALLGNMGGFFRKGFDEYLQNGIPWPFQNGFAVGTFFHLFANDGTGPLGTTLRSVVYSVIDPAALGLGEMDDRAFAVFSVNIFMQFTGFVMLPFFMGPAFSPIADPWVWLLDRVQRSTASNAPTAVKSSTASNAPTAVKNKRKKKKKAA